MANSSVVSMKALLEDVYKRQIVDGKAVSTDESAAVHTAHDIVCYESGRDFTYGEGTEADEHTAEEAEAHTVVHITQPGTYALSGTLSAGPVSYTHLDVYKRQI